MNSQAEVLNPSYSLRQSNLSMGKPQLQSNLYATSQVNLYPGNPQQQYYVTSSVHPQQISSAAQGQRLAGSRLNGYGQYGQAFSANVGKSAQVFTEKRESESRITYHPYVRTYIDYEERVVLVPVERVKINYYQKIYETQYVPQAVEQIVTETVPVEREVLNVKYIPVEQKIVHFPKDEKKASASGQGERKVIYYDYQGQQVTKSRHEAVLRGNVGSLVITSQQNLMPQAQSYPVAFAPAPAAFISSNPEVNGPQIVKSAAESEYHEQEQIILNGSKAQNSKPLGESHVKEVYKSNYDPRNEPLNTF